MTLMRWVVRPPPPIGCRGIKWWVAPVSLLKSGRRCRKSRPLVANGPEIAVSPIKHGFPAFFTIVIILIGMHIYAVIILVVIDDGAKIVEKVWLWPLMGQR